MLMVQNKKHQKKGPTKKKKTTKNTTASKNRSGKKQANKSSKTVMNSTINNNITDNNTNTNTKNDSKANKDKEPRTLAKVISDGLFTSMFWISDEKHPGVSYTKRISYIIYPFILIAIFACIIVAEKAYIPSSKDFYSFADDYTISFTMCFLFFFFFFANGVFIYHFNRHTSRFLRAVSLIFTDDKERKLNRTRSIMTVVSLALSLVALVYIVVAKDNERCWYNKLSKIEYAYYCALIVSTFYTALRIFFSIIVNSICIFVVTLNDANAVVNVESDVLFKRVYHMFNYFAVSLGIGVCFIIATGMMLYSDIRAAEKFNIIFKVYRDKWIVLLLLIIFAVFYLGTLVLSIASVYKLIKDKSLLSENSDVDKLLYYPDNSKSPFWTFVLTALLPGIAALVQILIPLADII